MTPSGILTLAVALYESQARQYGPHAPHWGQLHVGERQAWISKAVIEMREEEPYIDSLLSPGVFGFKIQTVPREGG